jgi:hypothetical protein
LGQATGQTGQALGAILTAVEQTVQVAEMSAQADALAATAEPLQQLVARFQLDSAVGSHAAEPRLLRRAA